MFLHIPQPRPTKRRIRFEDLRVGDAFTWEDHPMIKVSDEEVYCLQCGRGVHRLSPNELCTPIHLSATWTEESDERD